MVQRIKHETVFGTSNETAISLSDESVVPAETAEQWVDAVLTTGDFPWIQQAGGGQYAGLQESLSTRAEVIIGECDSPENTDCVIDTTVEGAYGGRVNSSTHVALRCPLRTFMLMQDAEAAEAICESHHASASKKIGDHITNAVATYTAADAALDAARSAYADAEKSL